MGNGVNRWLVTDNSIRLNFTLNIRRSVSLVELPKKEREKTESTKIRKRKYGAFMSIELAPIFVTRQSVQVVEHNAKYITWKIGQFVLKTDDAQK